MAMVVGVRTGANKLSRPASAAHAGHQSKHIKVPEVSHFGFPTQPNIMCSAHVCTAPHMAYRTSNIAVLDETNRSGATPL